MSIMRPRSNDDLQRASFANTVKRDPWDDIEVPPWKASAVCAQTDPEVFFPEKGGSTREAKSVCRGCPVKDECLEEALEKDESFGIWGGLSARERRALVLAKKGQPRRQGRGWTYDNEEAM